MAEKKKDAKLPETPEQFYEKAAKLQSIDGLIRQGSFRAENYQRAAELFAKAGDYSDAKKRAEECLHMVGLGNRMTHMPQEMSGGEQQRVAIARAVAAQPDVLFADEPTAELDTNTGLAVVKIFKDLCAEEGVSVIMTTHDTGLMDIGDAVYELEDGEVVGTLGIPGAARPTAGEVLS